ncbi:hypothetical protein AGMMS50249_5540 [candidate division SR1 bacterium]|nr:hypothetical protein AGMMS50249_5540 [candidate division SR1 bacterium]
MNYNFSTDKFVGQAIESIVKQTFSDFEFIIIDNCSSDESYKICEEYAKKDDIIKLFRNEENMGISFTRNRLIQLATTNYIVSQDSDDISFPNRVRLEYEFLEQNADYGAVYGNMEIIDEDGKNIGFRKYSPKIGKVILKKSPISNPASMFRKDIFLQLGGYDPGLNYGEDYNLWMKIRVNGYKIKNVDDNLIKYRIRNGQSKSTKLKETLRNTIFIQKKAIKVGLKPTFSDRMYHFLEKYLLLLPSWLILWLFTKLELKDNKGIF